MALFQEGSRERELAINIMIAIMLLTRIILLKLCQNHEDMADLEKAFPEMLRVACEGADARLKE